MSAVSLKRYWLGFHIVFIFLLLPSPIHMEAKRIKIACRLLTSVPLWYVLTTQTHLIISISTCRILSPNIWYRYLASISLCESRQFCHHFFNIWKLEYFFVCYYFVTLLFLSSISLYKGHLFENHKFQISIELYLLPFFFQFHLIIYWVNSKKFLIIPVFLLYSHFKMCIFYTQIVRNCAIEWFFLEIWYITIIARMLGMSNVIFACDYINDSNITILFYYSYLNLYAMLFLLDYAFLIYIMFAYSHIFV